MTLLSHCHCDSQKCLKFRCDTSVKRNDTLWWEQREQAGGGTAVQRETSFLPVGTRTDGQNQLGEIFLNRTHSVPPACFVPLSPAHEGSELLGTWKSKRSIKL